MLLSAILAIVAISVAFCFFVFFFYLLYVVLTEEKTEVEHDTEAWEAKHYYDPLPLSTPSPPDTIFKPTPYTFKLQNGNGVYSSGLPHAVINPAVLQYPPGHVLDQQRIPVPQSQPGAPQVQRKEREPRPRNPPLSFTRRRSRSRSPSPSPRLAKNVWSTNTDFQNPNNYYHQNYQHQHQHQRQNPPQQQQQQQQQQPPVYQQEFQRQYVQLTQDHYPVQQKHIRFPPEEYLRHQKRFDDNNDDHHDNQHNMTQHQHQKQPQPQYEPFMASSHATNVYQQHHSPRHKNKTKGHKSRSRPVEAVT